MKLNKKVTFEIVPDYPLDPDDEPGCAIGKITIGDFYEHFYMSPQRWAINDYIKQWDLAWQHFENNDTTCFIVNCQWNPLIEMWTFYKQNNTVKIQNQFLFDTFYHKIVNGTHVIPENCFEFIRPYNNLCADGEPAEEWSAYIIE